MARISDIHSFMVPAQSADTTNYQYTEIVGGLTGCTILVNSVLVNVAAQSNIILRIRTLSGGTGCWVGGDKNDVFTGSPNYN